MNSNTTKYYDEINEEGYCVCGCSLLSNCGCMQDNYDDYWDGRSYSSIDHSSDISEISKFVAECVIEKILAISDMNEETKETISKELFAEYYFYPEKYKKDISDIYNFFKGTKLENEIQNKLFALTFGVEESI